MSFLRISYCVLITIFFASVGGYLYLTQTNCDWLKDLSLNVGTEILGILLTVFLIDAVIRRNEEKERVMARSLAFQQLGLPLRHQLGVLHNLYKASITNPPEKPPVEVEELFSPSYFVQIAFLDFSKPAPLIAAKPLQWFDYLKSESEKFRLALGRTIEKYALFLNIDEIELLEELINSSFLAMLEQAPAIRDVDGKEGFKRNYNLFGGQGMDDLVRRYTVSFSRLVRIYNSIAPDRKLCVTSEMWRNDVAPQLGSARIA
jgi:hypothetical protein